NPNPGPVVQPAAPNSAPNLQAAAPAAEPGPGERMTAGPIVPGPTAPAGTPALPTPAEAQTAALAPLSSGAPLPPAASVAPPAPGYHAFGRSGAPRIAGTPPWGHVVAKRHLAAKRTHHLRSCHERRPRLSPDPTPQVPCDPCR